MKKLFCITFAFLLSGVNAELVDTENNVATNQTYLGDIDMAKGTLGDLSTYISTDAVVRANSYAVTNATFIAVSNAAMTATSQIALKQNVLTSAQTNAINSGVTATKVTKWDGYASQIAAKQNALTSAQTNAINSGVTAAKVATWDGYASQIALKQDALPYPTNAIPTSAISGLGSYAFKSDVNNAAVASTQYVDSVSLELRSSKQDALTSAQTNAINSGVTAAKVSTWDGYASQIALKQNVLTSAQTNAINSGVTATKVTKWDGYASQIAAKQNALTSAQTNAINSGATAAKVSTWDGYASQIALKQDGLPYPTNAIPYAVVYGGPNISPSDQTFSNAVLAVGIGIDTNTVAAINALVEQDDELPIGGAATIGGLLLALAAAVAMLKKGKADKVASATAGNLAGLDSSGNLTDSGKKASDFAPASAIPKIFYGTCSTSASTAAKVVECSTFTASDLVAGTIISVKFSNAQSYNGAPTLNINSTGAVNIKRVGTTNAARYEWVSGEMLTFVHDGTHWVLNGGGFATTTYYGVTKLSSSGTSTAVTIAQTPGGTFASAATFTQGQNVSIYSSSSKYALDALVVYGTNLYRCTTAITTAEDWNANHWTMISPLQTQINGKADWNLLKIDSPTVTSGSFALDPNTSVYRVAASISSGTATIPMPTATNIPNGSNYYCFEMEVSVGASATSLVGPTGWTWLTDGELPTEGFAGATVYIAVRLDCNSGARTFLANVWRVA